MKMLESMQQMDQLVLDVRDFKPGLYFVDLFINGQRNATVKMMVNR